MPHYQSQQGNSISLSGNYKSQQGNSISLSGNYKSQQGNSISWLPLSESERDRTRPGILSLIFYPGYPGPDRGQSHKGLMAFTVSFPVLQSIANAVATGHGNLKRLSIAAK
jgi:hypothetical protein